jgi:putative FmdB family regulatory protein
MPLYTYLCKAHGQFSAWAPMANSDDAQPCPTCEHAAPRALARPAVAGRAGEESGFGGDDFGGCGDGACGMGDAGFGGHCCGPGCMH